MSYNGMLSLHGKPFVHSSVHSKKSRGTPPPPLPACEAAVSTGGGSSGWMLLHTALYTAKGQGVHLLPPLPACVTLGSDEQDNDPKTPEGRSPLR